jgi:hypothetical protein
MQARLKNIFHIYLYVKQTDLQRRSPVLEPDIGPNFTILRYYSGLHVARASTLKKPANNFCKEDELKLSGSQNPADFYITLTQLKVSDWETTLKGEENNQKTGKFP